jgi:hypothetical protein
MTNDESLEGLVQTSLSSLESNSLYKEIDKRSSNTLELQFIEIYTLIDNFKFEKIKHKYLLWHHHFPSSPFASTCSSASGCP